MNTIDSLYIAAIGMVTPIGFNAQMTHSSLKAGISAYGDSPYATPQFIPIKMALIPEGALPAIDENIDACRHYSRWQNHLIQLAHAGLSEVFLDYKKEQKIPLLMACPEQYRDCLNPLPKGFLSSLIQQTGLAICPDYSSMIHCGRAGGIDVIDRALKIFEQTDFEEIVIGGVDSFQRTELLHLLHSQGRLAGPNIAQGFVPGEASAFIRLSRNPVSVFSAKKVISLNKPGISQEQGHLYSEEVYRGDGLALAVTRALNNTPQPIIHSVYQTMNGEAYWAKELGVAMTRNSKRFSNQLKQQHPADCYGDIGAASAAVLIGLAALDLTTQESNTAHLISCSSDLQYRGAITLATLKEDALNPRASEKEFHS
jgi:3-oxoacyl-[acyl-carrier-protein] synthase-1